MFRRKQNQTVQLNSVTPLGAKSGKLQSSSQVNKIQSSSSAGGIQPGGGVKAKLTPVQRSKSLEGTLDLDNTDLVTDKKKFQYSSHPHGLDDFANINQSKGTETVSPILEPQQCTRSQSSAKTNYPETSSDWFRDRTDTANSVKFDISYDL